MLSFQVNPLIIIHNRLQTTLRSRQTPHRSNACYPVQRVVLKRAGRHVRGQTRPTPRARRYLSLTYTMHARFSTCFSCALLETADYDELSAECDQISCNPQPTTTQGGALFAIGALFAAGCHSSP